MKVQHVITKADVGGAQTYVLELATVQAADGHTVSIVAGSLGRMADQARARGVVVEHEASLRREASVRSDLQAVRGLVSTLRASQPDVIHAHSSKAGVLARFAGRRLGIPTVYTAHGWPFQPGAPLPQRVMSWAGETMAARSWGEVICLTDAEAALARRLRVVPPTRLHVIRNGLPDIADDHRADVRRAGVDAPPRDRVDIVMVGRFAPPKQQRRVLTALSMIPDLPWRMTFVGDGVELQSLVEVADRFGLGDRVRFVGDRGDVAEILAENDVGVLFSKYEGMPLAMLEKMRAGLACVANDLPGVRELFGGVGGTVVAADEAALARAFADLIADRDALDRSGRAARQRYESDFSIDANHRSVMRVYAAAISAAEH